MAERDFNLEMTGEQVKDALQQLEDRVAEGWAVGEHDGVPVSSGSPYFENNSKWWAQQSAVSAAAAAESASTAEAEVEEGVRQGIVGAYVQETATPGAIATIDDGADNIPLKDLAVNLAINQPGTGDPSPSNVRPIYPVTEAEVYRTSQNMVDEETMMPACGFTKQSDGTWYLASPAYAPQDIHVWDNVKGCAGQITISAVLKYATSSVGWRLSIRYTDGTSETVAVSGTDFHTASKTSSASKTVAYVKSDYGSNVATTIKTLQIELGSAVSEYTPANLATALVNIGINQWDEETEQGYISNDGTLVSEASSIRSANYCACIGGAQYCVVAPASRAIHWYDKDKTHLSYDSISAPSTVVTAPANAAYFKLSAYLQGYPYANNMSVNFPARFNTYHEYTGHTVYGGELDVTTGVLTARYKFVDLGSLTYIQSGSGTQYFCNLSDASQTPRNNAAVCSNYPQSIISSGWNDMTDKSFALYNASLRIMDSTYSDTATFKAAMNGVQLVYELATPISIQLTPTEVNTLRGDNVIWADCGDITNCEYRADLKMYIDKVVGV